MAAHKQCGGEAAAAELAIEEAASRGAAMAAHKWRGGEAAAAEPAVNEAAAREAQRWPRTSTAAAKRQQRSWLLMRLRLRGAAMAAHKYCGDEAAAELAVEEAASRRRSDGRAQAGRRRSGSGAGRRGGCV